MFRIGPAANLIHRGRVELQGLVQDVLFHIVFTLVYDVGLGLAGRSDVATRRVILLQALKISVNFDSILCSIFINGNHRLRRLLFMI